MKPNIFNPLNQELEYDCSVSQQFYSPLIMQYSGKIHKVATKIVYKPIKGKILTYDTDENSYLQNFDIKIKETAQQSIITQDKYVNKILKKSKQNDSYYKSTQPSNKVQFYSFNFDKQYRFNQTPKFKCLLQTPLRNFNKNYNFEIQQLYSSNFSKQRFQQVKKRQNPCLYFGKAASFFVGIAISFQNCNRVDQTLFFFNLAFYVQPFNPKVWQEALNYLKKIGLWKKAYSLSKTAFLFIPSPYMAEQILMCGDKSQIPMHELRGLLSSLKNPQKYQRTIIESARFEIKNGKLWRGITLLNKFCALSNYKPSLCYSVILLAKCLQSIGYSQIALRILEKSIQKGITKFQAYYTYIQIKLRANNGIFQQRDVKFLDSNTDNLTMETRYRLSLCLAQILIKKGNKKYEEFINKSYKNASKFCKGVGKQRAFREIYFTLMSAFILTPSTKFIQLFQNDQNLIFLLNKKKYINGQQMVKYPFKNWKYYLHLALLKEPKILIQACEQNNQGRLIAQALHIQRLKKSPLQALKFWRKKIQQIPKSGQLWCEGGRIFLNLDQKREAIKCFQYAIHFTPQYGDSFIQLLKVHLSLSNFYEINQLRKNFYISEPYYGHILSFLQLKESYGIFRCSLKKVWQLAIQQINYALYSNNFKNQLTACNSYNQSLKYPTSPKIRQILFSSYQQIENKIIRN